MLDQNDASNLLTLLERVSITGKEVDVYMALRSKLVQIQYAHKTVPDTTHVYGPSAPVEQPCRPGDPGFDVITAAASNTKEG